jgi:hypothetical protein
METDLEPDQNGGYGRRVRPVRGKPARHHHVRTQWTDDRDPDNCRAIPPASEADFKALIMGMSAYAGRFVVQDDQVVIDPDVMWLPYSRQIRYFELDGDRLTLRTPVQELPIRPGRLLRNTIIWEREV